MANKIQVKRGVEANLPTLDVGEPAFTTDTKKPFIGSDAGNIELATKQQIDNLDSQIESLANGSPKGVYDTVDDLNLAFSTGDTNVYLVKADGNWYYWNGTAWTAGGVYQSTNANTILITDTGNLYDSENVEDALQEVKSEFDEHKSAFVNHLIDPMPHQAKDLQNTKTFRFGLQMSVDGNPQIIFEEVI